MHNCINFKLIDYEWATYLKNIVILEFDNDKLPIEKILSEYKNILDPDTEYVEILEEIPLFTPNDRLYSANKLHDDDVFFELHKEHDYFIQVSTDNSHLMNIYFGHTNYEEPHDENESNVDPIKTSLSNNYPNPFNPTTTIKFSLAKDSNVKLSIYNIKGQKIKTMINNKLVKGNHSVIWNGTNDKNQAVSSGIYFYSIETDDLTITKKMILMK